MHNCWVECFLWRRKIVDFPSLLQGTAVFEVVAAPLGAAIFLTWPEVPIAVATATGIHFLDGLAKRTVIGTKPIKVVYSLSEVRKAVAGSFVIIKKRVPGRR